MKCDLNDLTFLIPIRLDSIIRLENLICTLNYLFSNFNTNVIIVESSSINNGFIQRLINKKVKYIFIEDRDPVFYRTKYLNIIAGIAQTKFIAIWDSDVLIPKEQIIESVNKLRSGYDVAYPYDGNFYDTSTIIRELYFLRKKINVLKNNINRMILIYGDKMKGGALLVNKNSFINAGMENEKFYGWGPEDFERYKRWQILDYKIFTCNGPLFHFSHPRGVNSTFRSALQFYDTNRELKLTHSSSKEEILKSVK